MPNKTDYSTLLRQFNFTNLIDNDENDNLNYPLKKQENGGYIVTYQSPPTASVLLSTGYYDVNDAEFSYFRPINSTQQSLISTFFSLGNDYSVFFSDVANVNFQKSAIFEADIVFMQNDGASPYTPNSYFIIESTAGYSHDFFDPVRACHQLSQITAAAR